MKESTQTAHKATFNNKSNPFQVRLRDLANAYFQSHDINPTGDYRLYLKTLILVPSFVGLYTWIVFFTPETTWIIFALLALYGLTKTLIGFNVMHDACHGSYSTNKTVNNIVSYSMNMLGSNAFFWRIKHNVVHHTYTNIDGIDDDIMKSPIMRFCESQPRKAHHRYQHIFAPMLYCLATVFWVFFADFEKYFGKRISNTPINNIPFKEHVVFWLTKLYYAVFFIVIPLFHFTIGEYLIGYFFYNAVFGLVMSLVFQLAHVVEKTHFQEANHAKLNVETEWAIHQVDTTADFAADSQLANWFFGGLNFQTIHHLFPKVSHVHYKALQPLVKQACKEFNVQYNEYPTVTSAAASHLRFLKYLGRN